MGNPLDDALDRLQTEASRQRAVTEERDWVAGRYALREVPLGRVVVPVPEPFAEVAQDFARRLPRAVWMRGWVLNRRDGSPFLVTEVSLLLKPPDLNGAKAKEAWRTAVAHGTAALDHDGERVGSVHVYFSLNSYDYSSPESVDVTLLHDGRRALANGHWGSVESFATACATRLSQP